MNKPDSNLKIALLQHQRKDMQEAFFFKNPFLPYIKVPLHTPWSSSKQIIPFRNINCSKPECIYDLEDLLTLYQTSSLQMTQGLKCYSCGNISYLKNFFLDFTLKEIINQIYEKYGGADQVPFDWILLMKNGEWKPLLKETSRPVKSLRTSPSRHSKKSEHNGKVVGQEKLPNLSEYTQAEFNLLVEDFKNSPGQYTDIIIIQDGIKVVRQDISYLLQTDSINIKIMTLFINYCNSIQKRDAAKYKELENRCLVLCVEIVGFDKSSKRVDTRYVGKSQKDFEKNSQNLSEKYDKLILVLKFDERWIVVIVEFQSQTLYITDFLSGELSNLHAQEIVEIISNFVTKELNFNFENLEFYKGSKVKYLCDCGFYVLNYIYKCLNNNVITNIKGKFSEKELFRKQLVWLLLKNSKPKDSQANYFLPSSRDNHHADQDKNSISMRVDELNQQEITNHYLNMKRSANNTPPKNLKNKPLKSIETSPFNIGNKLDNYELNSNLIFTQDTRNHKNNKKLANLRIDLNHDQDYEGNFKVVPQFLSTPVLSPIWKVQRDKSVKPETGVSSLNNDFNGRKLPPIHHSNASGDYGIALSNITPPNRWNNNILFSSNSHRIPQVGQAFSSHRKSPNNNILDYNSDAGNKEINKNGEDKAQINELRKMLGNMLKRGKKE